MSTVALPEPAGQKVNVFFLLAAWSSLDQYKGQRSFPQMENIRFFFCSQHQVKRQPEGQVGNQLLGGGGESSGRRCRKRGGETEPRRLYGRGRRV